MSYSAKRSYYVFLFKLWKNFQVMNVMVDFPSFPSYTRWIIHPQETRTVRYKVQCKFYQPSSPLPPLIKRFVIKISHAETNAVSDWKKKGGKNERRPEPITYSFVGVCFFKPAFSKQFWLMRRRQDKVSQIYKRVYRTRKSVHQFFILRFNNKL